MSCCNLYYPGMSLPDVLMTANKYLPKKETTVSKYFVLPSLESLDGTLCEKEIRYYQTSFELVCSGVESFDTKIDFGETFYRGGEIQWADLAYKCDLSIISDYDRKLETLIHMIDNETPRVKSRLLLHGAGTGGTTLSKRLLWDLKDIYPSLRLKSYTSETANIILEIYRKTGKCVFISVEVGSTVISRDELRNLITSVNAGNARAFFLEIERNNGNGSSNDEGKSIIKIHDTLPSDIAARFYDRFSSWTQNDQLKNKTLMNITMSSDSEWIGQRCAFFYGFYTFGEEYNLKNIERTVQDCSDNIKALLSDLSLVTTYSQNICIKYSELRYRLGIDEISTSPYYLYEKLDAAVRKLIVLRDDGWRICHPLIAEKIMQTVHDSKDFQSATYMAADHFINSIYDIYGDNDIAADNILKELFIDRAYIDIDEKTRFSKLIEAIPEITKKEELFKTLIKLYPRNSHYYNHLARLLVYKDAPDYHKAIELLNTALRVADESKPDQSLHYTTLGVVYSKKILLTLKNERLLIAESRFAREIKDLILDIRGEYALADGAFIEARNSKTWKDSYVYFPNIGLECSLIDKMVGCDKGKRSRQQLIKDSPEFKVWFENHYGRAAQLFSEMERYCDASDSFVKIAKQRINAISDNDWNIKKELADYNRIDTQEAMAPRRAYSGAIYVNNGYSWDGLKIGDLKLVEEAMRKNLIYGSKSDQTQRDVRFWFEVFRRLPEFDSGESMRFISDYMKEGYEKSYLMFVLEFLRLEKGLATQPNVIKYISECKAQVPQGINTATFIDAYFSSMSACPVIPYKNVKREGETIVGLHEFYGLITSISGATKGTIMLDKLGLDVLFIPSFTDNSGNKREFTSANISSRVKFNIMFSYSGLRAWNTALLG